MEIMRFENSRLIGLFTDGSMAVLIVAFLFSVITGNDYLGGGSIECLMFCFTTYPILINKGTIFTGGHTYAKIKKGKVVKSFSLQRDCFKLCGRGWVCLDSMVYETERFSLTVDCRRARRIPSLSEVSAYMYISEIERLLTAIDCRVVEKEEFLITEAGAESEEIAEAIRHFDAYTA